MSLIGFVYYIRTLGSTRICSLTRRIIVLEQVNLVNTLVKEVLILYYFNWWLVRVKLLDVVV